jgi:hypothetical protein
MDTLGLDYEEFQEVLHLCRRMGIAGCLPGFNLRRFLIGHLRATLPETAAKIEALGEEHVRLLWRELQARSPSPRGSRSDPSRTAHGVQPWYALGISSPCAATGSRA